MNFADLKARSEGYRVEILPHVPGLEVSGRVRAVGHGVEGLRPGQEVAALTGGGAYAEVVVAEAATVFPLPKGWTCGPRPHCPPCCRPRMRCCTRWGGCAAGESVLVHGAAGGVGTVAGQLARAAGAGAVYGVVSSATKAEYAREYGYDEVFVGDAFADGIRRATGGRGVDLVLDPVGGDTLRRGLGVLAVFGRLVSFGNASGAEPWQVGPAELMGQGGSVAGFSILSLARTAPEVLRPLVERAFRTVVDGVVDVPISAEFPLSAAADAHTLMGGRTSTGKLLLRVAEQPER